MGRDILEGNPAITQVLRADKSRPLSEIARVRRGRYDVVFDFMNNPRSVALAALSGARDVVGFRHGLRSLLYKMPVSGFTRPEYVAKRKIEVIRYWLSQRGHGVPEVKSYRPTLSLS